MADITVIILAYNEELHIERCICSLLPIACKIFIVDSYSTDRTVEIAKSLGAKVVQRKWKNYADQFQWALDNCNSKTDWVMRMDADEYPEPELVKEIQRRLPAIDDEITGINLRRRHIFMGRWIKYGTRYPLVLLRIWRNGKGYIEQRWMDEHIVLKSGRATTFEHDFSDHNLHNISWWIEKHNKYATREAIDVLKRKYSLIEKEDAVNIGDVLSQAGIKRIVKERIYNVLPTFFGPLFYFFYRYFIRLGFLDGKEGAVYHFLQGFWYRFLVDVKVYEVERRMKSDDMDCKEAIRRELSIDPFF